MKRTERHHRRWRWGWGLAALLLMGHAAAVTPSRYFADLKSWRADFVQVVLDEGGEILERSSGRASIQRPGQFHWFYQEPFPQHIVSDGEALWIHDVELAQITLKPMADTLSATPAALLSGALELETAFIVAEPVRQEGLTWYQLTPKEEGSNYAAIWLGFSGDELQAVELVDRFQQRTRMGFSAIQKNIPLDEGLFTFDPPPGVDVVGNAP